jgi:ribose-phosphate pyrophosphokinase
MKNHKCILFSGNSTINIAKDVANLSYGIKLGDIFHHQFPSGEWYSQYKENIRGADIFLLQSIIHPVNDNLMQLLVMADAARRASAGRITAVIPYMGYSRQDRKDKSRVPISAKLLLDIIAAAGIDRVVTMDLHAPQIAGFTNLPFDHLHFRPTLVEALKDKDINVIVAPDIGAVKRVGEFAEKVNREVAFIVKKRKSDTDVEVTQFVGDVKDKNVLILDDLTESAGTLIAAANCCKNNNARNVYCGVTHNCLSVEGLGRLGTAQHNKTINGFYASNTTGINASSDGWFTTLGIEEVFSKAIYGIHNDSSISSLFE